MDKQRTLYGRRRGRPLNASRQEALDQLLPKLGVESKTVFPEANITPFNLFGYEPPALWLEIGFGNGEHLSAMMRQNPADAYIGAEPFINGMAAFLKDIKDEPHQNIRVWMDDALALVDALADNIIDGIYVLNPDPWPKVRHHKRRIINQGNLDRFARILKPGGKLVMTTDVDDLAEWMVTEAYRHKEFKWSAERADDWREEPDGWIKTRYEQKGKKAGRRQSYLIFEKTSL